MEKKKKTIELSARLSAVAGMVTPGSRVADVGCDHGFVSIFLVQNGLASHVTAMDVRQGPLSRAREHVQQYGLSGYIDLRLSDGLSLLTPEDKTDCVILAGMGGRLMQRIIADALAKGLVISQYVLQPQSEWAVLRRFLREAGYRIVQEEMVLEDGKFYPVMKVQRGAAGSAEDGGTDSTEDSAAGSTEDSAAGSTEVSAKGSAEETAAGRSVPVEIPQEMADAFGPLLLAGRHSVLGIYLEQEMQKYDRILGQIAAKDENMEAARRSRLLKETYERFFSGK